MNELNYFKERVDDYINFILKKEYVEKVILVTFPHYKHISSNHENYSIDVSELVKESAKNKKNVYHLNFSELINDKKITLKKNDFKENDPASHLNGKYHADIFVKNIINYIENIK